MVIIIPASPEKTTYQINRAYVDYISDSGYVPWLVTPQIEADVLAQGEVGLLLPGGKDIDPIFYGDSNWASHASDPEKDKFERELFYAFLKVGKPIFGICRGFQLILREYILKNHKVSEDLLYQQHIEGHATNPDFQLSRAIPSHYIKARVDLLYGKSKKPTLKYIPVNSMHHQYIHVYKKESELEKSANINGTLQLTGWTTRGLDADEKGVVAESIIIKGWGKSKITAVQWHPEELKDYGLLKNHFGGE
jgi:gamma-glutamyl-gamma-aminobutyrate hydrolase PuuD